MTRASPGASEHDSPLTSAVDSGPGDHRGTSDAAPIDDAAFAAAMATFSIPHPRRIAVAVSGGGDSMALVLLLRAWCKTHDATLTALTIDHRLRDESRDEAAQVAVWCTALGVSHATLPWTLGPSQRGLSRSPQAAARAARYDLLTGWCRAHGHTHLCVAHHADDQVETFFMRLARGSGVDGLAGMAPESRRAGVVLLRPLLDFPKASLHAMCVTAGQAWIEDPSNANRKSTRVRFRQARAVLAEEGLDADRIRATVGHMQRARRALETMVNAHLAQTCRWEPLGTARLDLQAFVGASAEIVLRALARILVTVAGADYGPRFDSLERLHAAMTTGPWRDATLHGCHILREGSDVLLCREAAATGDDVVVHAGDSVLWDGRFRIQIPAGDFGPFNVRPMTPGAWKLVVANGKTAPVSAIIRSGLPMLVDDKGVAMVPWVSYVRPDLQNRLNAPILCEFVGALLGSGDDMTMWPK